MCYKGSPGVAGVSGDLWLFELDVTKTVGVIQENWNDVFTSDSNMSELVDILKITARLTSEHYFTITDDTYKQELQSTNERYWKFMEYLHQAHPDIVFDMEMRGIRTMEKKE